MTAAPLLAFQADPPSDRPVLLLIHGMLSSDMQWQPNSALSRQFRVIRVDLPGHGASAPPMTPAQAQPEAMVAGLEQVRHDLGIACWHVCGASFGAGIALRYALDHPRVCQSVSFTNGNAALRPSWSEEDLRAQTDLVARLRGGGKRPCDQCPITRPMRGALPLIFMRPLSGRPAEACPKLSRFFSKRRSRACRSGIVLARCSRPVC